MTGVKAMPGVNTSAVGESSDVGVGMGALRNTSSPLAIVSQRSNSSGACLTYLVVDAADETRPRAGREMPAVDFALPLVLLSLLPAVSGEKMVAMVEGVSW